MAWNENMKAWASEGPEKKPRGTILEIEETLADGWVRGTEMQISRRGLKLILLAIRIAQHI